MSTRTFTDEDKGCWVDGAFGLEHSVEKIGEMLVECDENVNHPYYESDDDGWFRDVTDALQEHTEEGLFWTWDAGDLILMDEEGN
jgi:hypothetical protein